ncbi:NACHT domain-containing protein [Amycolatopsis japonica]|uniref:NACHT domain-containing protein n=1 Tax=Amycolatopsis japonica TaxID=208439 RepID=UPI0037A6108B
MTSFRKSGTVELGRNWRTGSRRLVKKFSYADAVKLLGPKENKLVAALDKIVGTTLLGGSTLGLVDLLGWFDAKADFIRLSHELLTKLAGRRHGLKRHTRTERLQAAHAVIVVVAFTEALQSLNLPRFLERVGLERSGQLRLMGLENLFDGSWPLPSASRSYDDNLRAVTAQYRQAGRELLFLFECDEKWPTLEPGAQEKITQALFAIEPIAANRYQELVRKLAGDYPELGIWLQISHETCVLAGMARLEAELVKVQVGTEPDVRMQELAKRYHAVLGRPIIDPDEVPAGLSLPVTRDAYIDPDFQVVIMTGSSFPARLSSWRGVPARSDLYRYLAGYLTSPEAISLPLVVLGDPGSGKSLLTRILAARLPVGDFLPIRIELRAVAAQEQLLGQLEDGLHSLLHEPTSFAQLSRTTGGALPVVVLDGFDELLQATGVSQTDYLKNVVRFQQECQDAGRPVVVIVTSRISVSNGMDIPQGSHVLRLVPFTDVQVESWLDVWNEANAGHFDRNSLEPLESSVVLGHRDLAVQPLLLLMLALYDANGNALQRDRQNLNRSVLYERILTAFASRQIRKEANDFSGEDLKAAIDNELDRLSVVAFAMFHRGAQWVSEHDLDNDLAALLDERSPDRVQRGMRRPLSAGGTIIGRFFFVHMAEASRDSQTLRTYEFLHPTFGEYLVARFVWRVLDEMRETLSTQPRRLAEQYPDDSDLHALLSFTPLTSRKPVIDFLVELAAASEDANFPRLIERLFGGCNEHLPRRRDLYIPVIRSVPSRYAIYSLNLTLLATVVNRELDVRTLGISDWPRQATFWKSQLSPGEWSSLVHSLRVDWSGGKTVILSIGECEATDLTPTDFGPASIEEAARDSHFMADSTSNTFRYAFEALPRERYSAEYARALVELAASPVDPRVREDSYLRWCNRFPDLVLERLRRDIFASVDSLRRLGVAGLATSSSFMVQLCDRIGRGGPDSELLDLFADLSIRVTRGSYEVAMLDAWLRLHEQGFVFAEQRRYPDLKETFERVDFHAIRRVRPDLLYRAGTVAYEIDLFGDKKSE